MYWSARMAAPRSLTLEFQRTSIAKTNSKINKNSTTYMLPTLPRWWTECRKSQVLRSRWRQTIRSFKLTLRRSNLLECNINRPTSRLIWLITYRLKVTNSTAKQLHWYLISNMDQCLTWTDKWTCQLRNNNKWTLHLKVFHHMDLTKIFTTSKCLGR